MRRDSSVEPAPKTSEGLAGGDEVKRPAVGKELAHSHMGLADGLLGD